MELTVAGARAGGQRLLPLDQGGLGQRAARQPVPQRSQVLDILLDGGRRALLFPQVPGLAANGLVGQVIGFLAHNGVLHKSF